MDLVVNLDCYSGPLDLLLDLISKQKLDIYDIEISKITKHYLDIIENSIYSENTDISSFLLMATTLIEIKSKSLIPKNDEVKEEEVTREDLIKRLVEYKKFKEVSKYFKILEQEGKKSFCKVKSDMYEFLKKDTEIILNTDINLLSSLMENIVKEYDNKKESKYFEKIIKKDIFPIEKYILKIKNKILEKHNAEFKDFIFEDGSREELITIFISILELVKNNFIKIYQDKNKNIKLNLVGENFE